MLWAAQLTLYLVSFVFFAFIILFSMVSFITQANSIVHQYIPSKIGRYFQMIQSLPIIFSIEAFVSVFSFVIGHYMQFLMDLAEALAVHFFVDLLLFKLGGIATLQRQFVDEKISRALPSFVKFGTLQFVVMKPVLGLVNLILSHTDVPEGEYWLTLKILVALTSMIGFGTLFFIYYRIHAIISDFKPGRKFLALKLCVFLPIFQTFLFDFLYSHGIMEEADAVTMDNALLLIWLLPVSIFMFDTFVLLDLREQYQEAPSPSISGRDSGLEEAEPLLKSWVMV